MDDVHIIGVHTTAFGKHLNLGIKDLTAMTVTGGLMGLGIGKEAIQAAWFSNSGWGDQKGQAARGTAGGRQAVCPGQ